MKSRIVLFLAGLLAIGSVHGQHKFGGTVVDNAGSALPGVNVLLLSTKDSSLVKGSVSDGKGRFDLENIAAGAYLLNIRFVGFKTQASRLDVNGNLEVGIVRMENETTQLDEVAVKAVKPFYEQQMDRIVVNVQNTITAAGGSALDVLERSPGVRLNRGTNDLSLNGKNGIVVMINGKPTRQSLSTVMQLLGGLNASSIEKIELITNPPAQYEAAGNGGIINIQIAKSTDLGTNGSVSLRGGYGQREKAGASLNFNHRANKANLYGDLSYSRDHRYAVWTNDRTTTGELETARVQSEIHREPVNTVLNGRLGVDYQLTQKTLIGGFVSGFSNIWDMTALTDGSTVRSTAPASFVAVDLLERGRLKHLMGNFNLNQKLGQKTEMNFDLDYLYYQDKNETRYQNDFFNATGEDAYGELRKSNKLTPKKIWVASLGFTSKLGDKFQLEYGLQGIRSRLNNDVMVSDLVDGAFVIADPFTEISQLGENIGAAYASANYTINEKTSVKAGLRYEHSETDLDVQDQGNVLDLNISKFFPTVFFSRKLAKETSMQLSYGRRITRPSFGDLAPFFIFLDPTTYIYGNTSLRPAISNNFRAGVTYKQSVFSVEHTYEKDAIEGYQPLLIEGTDQQVYT
ncbi:MAG: TonB-dependent receptor, partial [Cytophagales bacterium]|nr:TonB-dependent receptor [Cytophagales bacterium]